MLKSILNYMRNCLINLTIQYTLSPISQIPNKTNHQRNCHVTAYFTLKFILQIKGMCQKGS